MKSWLLAAAMLVLVVPKAGVSATYYIDFSSGSDANAGTSNSSPWKYAPGMNGYAHVGYVHAAGDQFIFKGGVTWDNTIAPWNITNSGTSGNNDYYGVDQTWYSSSVCGTSWCRPIFDGGSMASIPGTVIYDYWKITGSYVTLDNLTLQNIGIAGTNQGNYAIFLQNNHDILIENMYLPVMSRIAIEISMASGGTLSNFEFKNNDISACSWGIGGGYANSTIMQNVKIHGNAFHDFTPQLASGAHGDGIYLFGPTNAITSYIDQVYIYNNKFYGDFEEYPSGSKVTGMSAFIWPSTAQGTVYIYNNHMTYSAGSGPANIVTVGGTPSGFTPAGNFYIYNNSLLGDTSGSNVGLMFLGASGAANVVVENNITVGQQYIYNIGSYGQVTNFISDYNDYYNWSRGITGTFAAISGTLYSYARFKPLGYEAHGLNANPLFVSSTDLHLQACSPVIGQGTDLSGSFTADADGNPRPASGAWDMGAYVHPGGQPCAPSSPTLKLKAVH